MPEDNLRDKRILDSICECLGEKEKETKSMKISVLDYYTKELIVVDMLDTAIPAKGDYVTYKQKTYMVIYKEFDLDKNTLLIFVERYTASCKT